MWGGRVDPVKDIEGYSHTEVSTLQIQQIVRRKSTFDKESRWEGNSVAGRKGKHKNGALLL